MQTIPATYMGFNILPYKTVQDIKPESRQREFLQQVQHWLELKTAVRMTEQQQCSPYWQNIVKLEEDEPLGPMDFSSSDEWIQGIIYQRKVLFKAYVNAQWEEIYDRNKDEEDAKKLKAKHFEQEMEKAAAKEKREDEVIEARQELIYKANRAVVRFRKELRVKANNKSKQKT